MGGHLSPILANLYMEELEHKVLCTALTIPKLYLRYVDDIFAIWDETQGDQAEFLALLNEHHEDIVLTEELKKDRSLSFLDVTVTRPLFDSESGLQKEPLQIALYRKPTHTDHYLQYKSSHPQNLKKTLFRSLVLRAHRLLHCCSSQLNHKLQYLRAAFSHSNNGYPLWLIDLWLEEFRVNLLQNPAILELRPCLNISSMFDNSGQQIFLYPDVNEFVQR